MGASWIEACTVTCAAGAGLVEVREALRLRRTGLRQRCWPGTQLDTWLGPVSDDLDEGWPEAFAAWDSRNNKLAWAGLKHDRFRERLDGIMARVGAGRTGLIVGTSTSSIGRTEAAYAGLAADGGFTPTFMQPGVHNPHSTGAFLAAALGIGGPVMTVSTACSSSAKALASADRWLRAGIADAVLVAGVDSLCQSTIHGFESLQLLSRQLCRPFDASRDGLNIGEAAAFAILTRAPFDTPCAQLLGYGESCDAYHMSSPHPEGLGAQLAIKQALEMARLTAGDLGYVNLHGTGTRTNDVVESQALAAVLPPDMPVSSTKGWTGHTLGAAGLVEAVLTMDVFTTGILPGNLNLTTRGSDISYPVMVDNAVADIDAAMSNSFGFGGNNCVLILGRAV